MEFWRGTAVLSAARTSSIDVTPESSDATVGFRTSKLRVSIDKNPLCLKVTDLDGHVIVEDLPGRPVEFNGSPFRVYRKSPLDEHYFGLGDKPGPLDRRNSAFSNWNTDVGWQESTDPIYKSIPYFLTFRNGIAAAKFLDNTWHSSFDFNKEYLNGYSFGAESGPLDYYILYGPDPKQVVETWAGLTGSVPLPPLWSLGYQQSRYSYYPEAEVRRVAARLRAERIPADVIRLDIDYQLKNRPFTVDPDRFPHFAQMIQDLKADHFKTVLITDLHVAYLPNQDYKPYDEGAAGDHFVHAADGKTFVGEVWPGPAVFPDFWRKASREWWGTLYKDFVDMGVAGFWNDMNEPSVFQTPTKTMPLDNVHRIEEPGFKTRAAAHLEVHNIFGMQNTRGTCEGLLKLAPDLRPFVMTRASFAGGQRYAVTWTGDNSSTWNHLRQTTPQLCNLGLSGFAMAGADVGGFTASPQPELLTRWVEVAAFHPIDRDQTTKGSRPQEPWENGSPHDIELRRHYIKERYQLMPYIYTTAEEMSRTGLPIMRPVFLEFPRGTGDGQTMDTDGNQFLLWPNLLVAQSPFPDERLHCGSSTCGLVRLLDRSKSALRFAIAGFQQARYPPNRGAYSSHARNFAGLCSRRVYHSPSAACPEHRRKAARSAHLARLSAGKRRAGLRRQRLPGRRPDLCLQERRFSARVIQRRQHGKRPDSEGIPARRQFLSVVERACHRDLRGREGALGKLRWRAGQGDLRLCTPARDYRHFRRRKRRGDTAGFLAKELCNGSLGGD
jgi:alpha-glucosidase